MENHGLQGLTGLQAGIRWEKAAQAAPEGGASLRKVDQVDLSSRAQEVSALRKELQGIPEVRADRVAHLKAQIASGSYSVPAEAIAERLLLGKVLEP